MREILCFGDSNTYGLIPGTKERYKENIRWTGILQQKLKEHIFLFEIFQIHFHLWRIAIFT